MSDNVVHLIIIGGGCAGLTNATWSGRSGISTIVFTSGKCELSSMISTTSIVENFSTHTTIEGKELIKRMKKQAKLYGARIIEKCIVKVDFSNRPFKVYDCDGIEYKSSSILISTGSIPNRLNIENEDKLWGKYISTCVTCDGKFFKSKRVIILGGGDSAIEEALSISRFTNKITLIHRRNTFRASVVLQKRLFSHSKIKVMCDYTITKFNVDDKEKLISVICKNGKDRKETELKVDAVFYALGFTPNTKLFEGIIEMDKSGYIIRKDTDNFESSTSIKGVFCAGDCAVGKYKQAMVAAADGTRSSLDINKFLHDVHILEDEEF